MNDIFPPAQLARCHRFGEQFYFRIGKAQDVDATLTALAEQVPEGDYRYDALNQEWRVSASHAPVLDSLFLNFPRILRSQSGAYYATGNSPHNSPQSGSVINPATAMAQVNQVVESKWFSLLGYAVVAAICIALWPWLADSGNGLLPTDFATNSITAPTDTATALQGTPRSQPAAQPVIAATVTATIVIEPTVAEATSNTVTVVRTANLRTGPGTDYEIEGQLEGGASVNVTGQVVVPGSFSWYRLDNGLWIYSPLVSGVSDAPPIVNPVANPAVNPANN